MDDLNKNCLKNINIILIFIFYLLFYSISLISLISCSSNLLEETAQKNTDEAKYYQAKMYIDEKKYLEAITLLESLNSSFLSKEIVKKNYSGALAGYCGLEFIPFFNSFTNVGDSGNIFYFLMASFIGKSTYSSSCISSETQMLSLIANNSDANKNTDYRLFMSLLSMTKIGSILHENADIDGSDNLGDGSTDAGFSSCDSGDLSDDNLNQLITGIGLMIENLTFFISALGGNQDLQDQIEQIESNCEYTFPGGPPIPAELQNQTINPCAITETENIDENMRYILRSILEEINFGVGSCDSADLVTNPLGLLDCCSALRNTLYGF